MIKELEKQEAIHIWNNHYQGTFTPLAFDELLKTNELINHDLWNKEVGEIKDAINGELFQKFLEKYRSYRLGHKVQELETFLKEGISYYVLNSCVNLKGVKFKACFLLNDDYTVQYLCVDSKIEIASLSYVELNQVYNKHKELMPPPLEFINEFNLMNAELSKQTGNNVDRTIYQAWFKLVPNIRLDPMFAKAYSAYHSVGERLFGEAKEGSEGDFFEYVPVG